MRGFMMRDECAIKKVSNGWVVSWLSVNDDKNQSQRTKSITAVAKNNKELLQLVNKAAIDIEKIGGL